MGLKSFVKPFLYFSVISILAVPFAVYEQVNSSNLLLLVVIGFGISCIAAATFFGIYLMLTRLAIEISSLWIFLSLVLAGALRGLVMHQSISEIGLRQPTGFTERIFASIATTVVWVLLFAWTSKKFDEFNERYVDKLRRKLIVFASAVRGNRSPSSSGLRKDVKELDSLLKKTLDPVSQEQHSREDLLSAAEQLRVYVHEVVRPLSRQIWLNRDSMPRLHRRYLLEKSISQPRFGPLPPVAFISGLILSNLAVSQSLLRGLLASGIVFILTLPSFQLINYLNTKRARGILINSSLLLLPGIASGFIFLEINKRYFGEDTGIFSWFAVVIIFGIGVVASMLGVVKMNHDQLIQELDRPDVTMRTSSESYDAIESGKLASYLHNTLQSELLALSFQMEQAARDPQSAQTQGVLEKIQSTLKRSLADQFYEAQIDPSRRLEKLVSSWSGLLNIELELQDLSLFAHETQNLIVATIEESITNSFRHGRASHYRASLFYEGGPSVRLVFWSNSEWSNSRGSGLGQQWILDNCLSMTKESSDSGSQLTVTFPAVRASAG